MEQVLANGLYLGVQYALIALGLTLIFALMNILNFAHGQLYVIGGFVTYTIYGQLGLPFVVALFAAAVTLAVVGAFIERFLFRTVIKAQCPRREHHAIGGRHRILPGCGHPAGFRRKAARCAENRQRRFQLGFPADHALRSDIDRHPILRLRGVYFAMVTLVLTEVARLLMLALPITDGAKGITNIPLPGAVKILGLTLIPDFATLPNVRPAFYYLSVILMILSFAGLYRLVNSRLGKLCRSLQQNEELASSIGVNIAYLRVIAYVISSFLGGIGGAIFAAMSQSVYPSSFTIADSINFMLNCFLGGLGYVFGPILGTFVLYLGWDLLFETGEFQLLIFSTVLIGLILLVPNGLLSVRFSKARKEPAGGE